MELKLEPLETNGIPQDCFISVRVGDMQKLSRISSLRSYRFPNKGDRLGKVDLFKRIGSCSVNVDPEELGTREVFLDCTKSGYGNMKLAVDVGLKAESGISQPQKANEPGVETSKAKLAGAKMKQANDYLHVHGIESLLSHSVQELLRERPDDPAGFLASKLIAGAGGSKSVIKCPPINRTQKLTDEKPMPEPKMPTAQRPSSSPEVHRPSSRPAKLTPLSNAPTSPTGAKVFNKSPSMCSPSEKKKRPQAVPPPEEKEVPPIDREPREGNGTSDDIEQAKQAACAALMSIGPGNEVSDAALEDMKAEAFGALSNLMLDTTGNDELEDAKEEVWNSLMKALSPDIPRGAQLEDLKEEAHQALLNVLGDETLPDIEDAKQSAFAALNTVLFSDTNCAEGATLDLIKEEAYHSLSQVLLSASNVAVTDELFEFARTEAVDALTKALGSGSVHSHSSDDVETMKENAWQSLNSVLMDVTDEGLERVKVEAHQALTHVLAGAFDNDSPLWEVTKHEAWTSLESAMTCPEIPAQELEVVKTQAHTSLSQALCSEKDMEEAAGMALQALQALNDNQINKTPTPEGKHVLPDLYSNMVNSGTK